MKSSKQSNREHDDYIVRARLAVENPLADALASLADHVNLGGARVVVFNPLPWARDGLVQVNAQPFPPTTGVRCVDTQQRAPGGPFRHRRAGRPAEDRHLCGQGHSAAGLPDLRV